MFTLKLEEKEVNLIAAALGELPAKTSRELLNKIEMSIVGQIKEIQTQAQKESKDEK